MLDIGTKVKIIQPAILNEFDVFGNIKFKKNDSPLYNATGVVVGHIGERYYVDLDDLKKFIHDAQKAPRAFLETELEVV